jgi:hypothetical protein
MIALFASVACHAGSLPRSPQAPRGGAASLEKPREVPQGNGGVLHLLGSEDAVIAQQASERGYVVAVTAAGFLRFDPKVPEVVRRSLFQGPADRALISARGDRALLAFGGRVELWATDTERKIATLTTTDHGFIEMALSANGAAAAVSMCAEDMPKGAKAPADETPCGTVLVRGEDGVRVAVVPGEVAELAFFSFSDDARYLVQTGSQKRMIYEVSTGRLALRRLGGRLEPGADIFEVFQIESDKLVMSRFGVVEYDDLRTGRVVASQHYDAAESGATFRHLRVAGLPIIATLWNEGERVSLWNYESRKLVKTVVLKSHLKEPCNSCTLSDHGDGKLSLSVQDSPIIDAATGQVEKQGDKNPLVQSETVLVGATGLLRREYPESATEVCRYMTVGTSAGELQGQPTPSTAGGFEVPPAFCSGASMSAQALAVSDNGALRVYDLAARKERLQFGQVHPYPDHGGGLSTVAREGVFGLRATRAGQTLWLTQKPAAAPFVGELGDFMAEPAQTDDYRFFAKYRTGTEARSEIIGHDRVGKEVLRDAIPGYARSLMASGNRVVVKAMALQVRLPDSKAGAPRKPHPKVSKYVFFLCEVSAGCKPVEADESVLGIAGSHVLTSSLSESAHAIRNLDTGTKIAIDAECAYGLGITMTKEGLRVLCRVAFPKLVPSGNGEPTPTFAVFDEHGRKVHVLELAEGLRRNLGYANPELLHMTGSRLLLPLESGRTRYALIDVRQGLVATILGDHQGALALLPDGRFERFGDSTRFDGALRCLKDDIYHPAAACGTHLAVAGW